MFVNLKGREPEGIVAPGAEYEAVRQRVVAALESLRHPETSQPLVERIIPGEEVAHGPFAKRGPDLHVILDGYRTIAFPLFTADGRVITRQIRGDSGCHRSHGLLIARGPELRAGETLSGARIIDLAPTILHLMGEPVPDDMDGRVLTEALVTSRPVGRYWAGVAEPEGEAALSEEAAEVEDRLRALGYLG